MIKVDIEPLKADYGDCIFITVSYDGKEFIIMMDSGTARTYSDQDRLRRTTKDGDLKSKLKQLREDNKRIDLLIITHVDDDHIGGVISWFKDQLPPADFVRRIWMNDDIEVFMSNGLNNTSAQAASLKSLLKGNNIPFDNQIIKGRTLLFDWGRMVVLAPLDICHNKIAVKIAGALNNATKDRYDVNIKTLLEEPYTCGNCTPENKASMAFLLQTKDRENCLLLGDADIDTVMDSLEHTNGISLPLKCKWVKLSHHGSKNNFKPKLLEMIDAENYIISTNGMRFGHPDKEVIAYLVDKTSAMLWFNYKERPKKIFTEQDNKDYPDIKERIKFF